MAAVLLGGLLALGAGACSSGDGGEDVAYALPDSAEGPDMTPGFTPADGDAGGSDAGTEPEIAIWDTGSADDAEDAVGTAEDLGDGDQADTGSGPDIVVPITSCASHCGVYLEDNDCHCHESCLGDGNCCPDFQAVCTCKKDPDCDDANDCTADTCKASGYCFQQPMKACCMADSECGGADACHAAKCISGTCTLQPMDCNDGIDCTSDWCDQGACQHKPGATQCLIDGACRKAGDQDPDSGGCATCDPAKSQTAWTPKAGMCAVGGQCIKSGDPKSQGETCAICDPTKATTDWSVKSGTCLIGGACYKSGEPNPASACQVCDPAVNQLGWSGKSGFCAIDGNCYGAAEVDPSNTCLSCDPTKSKNAWTVKTAFCFVDGACMASGAAAIDSGGCKVCDTKTPEAWTVKVGASCSTGSSCVSGAKCDASGTCTGTKAAGCCVNDDDCAADATLSPEKCQFKGCDKLLGKCILKDTPGCCVSGVCCDVGSMTFKPANTVCGTMKQGEEYKCDGDKILKRLIYAGCTGTSPSQCYSSTPGYGEWQISLQCSVGDICVNNGSPSCKTP